MPLLEISLETATKFYAWGWRASIMGAVITAIGVILLMWGTRVRDFDTESRLSRANLLAAQTSEKAAALEVRAEELKAENLQLSEKLARAVYMGTAWGGRWGVCQNETSKFF